MALELLQHLRVVAYPLAENLGQQRGEARIGLMQPTAETDAVRLVDDLAGRGRLEPEARLDLHGMTQSAAYRTLLRFLIDAHAREKSLVLVITGKGGVLRGQLPLWLGQADLRGLVAGLREAHVRHGGAGAFYVLMRKHRRAR